jgi:hypothetical protein
LHGKTTIALRSPTADGPDDTDRTARGDGFSVPVCNSNQRAGMRLILRCLLLLRFGYYPDIGRNRGQGWGREQAQHPRSEQRRNREKMEASQVRFRLPERRRITGPASNRREQQKAGLHVREITTRSLFPNGDSYWRSAVPFLFTSSKTCLAAASLWNRVRR